MADPPRTSALSGAVTTSAALSPSHALGLPAYAARPWRDHHLYRAHPEEQR